MSIFKALGGYKKSLIAFFVILALSMAGTFFKLPFKLFSASITITAFFAGYIMGKLSCKKQIRSK